MEEWKTDRIENLIDALIDYRGKTPQKDNQGIPLITAKIVKNGRIDTPEEFLAHDDYDSWMRRGYPQIGDVVLTTEAPLGEVAQISYLPVALAQRIVTLRGKEGILDSTYLKYFLQSEIGQKRLSARETGTTVTGIKQSELRKVEITYPSFPTQRKIASILKSIDEKIELNNHINHNLEEQAQALYKSWFVDFEPFQEGEFVESELGLIPKGWKVVSLDSLCSIISRGFSPKYSESTTDVVLGQRCVRNNMIDLSVSKTHVPKNLGERALCRYDILINSTGMGSLGRVAQIYFKPERMTYDSHLTLVRAKSSTLEMYLGRNLLSRQDEIENMAVGSTGQTELPRDSVKAMSILLPCDTVLDQFGASIRAIAGRIQSNLEENVGLTAMRDYLLPKLMSGELKINDLDC